MQAVLRRSKLINLPPPPPLYDVHRIQTKDTAPMGHHQQAYDNRKKLA